MKSLLKKLSDRAASILRKISSVQRQRRKANKAKKDLPLQAEVAKKLDRYIAEFLTGKIERVGAVAKKPELVGRKIIWQYWQQGLDENTPNLVCTCFDSVKRHSNGYEVILLSKATLKEYIDELPDFVWDKFGTGGFDFPKIANLVRLQLLSAYGGVWLDSTAYLTNPLKERWLQQDFFALQRSEAPPPDAAFFNKSDPLFFSWNPANQVTLLNAFMVAKPHHRIIDDLLSIHLAYWKNEAAINHYFFFQILFNRMMRNAEWKDLNCEIVGHTDCHKLLMVAFDRFDREVYAEAIEKSDIHKLSLYLSKKRLPARSFADVIINRKNEK
ncbi:capsular polysaccharide synthesis protein [Parapedobacter pyrenivorans]|uniref:capsular polysaccharide synthesis protein n=1 Tax=Parapedobacter pyrenivorans TaxID=1305674 RepID=UPI0033420FF3